MTSSRIDVRPARIRFLTPEEGGRPTAPSSGVRSQIRLGELQTSCIVEDDSGQAQFQLGETVEVHIRVMFPDWVGEAFALLKSVELFEGSRLVATGEFRDRV